ncbi:hypothetical protein BDN72DRAFT_875725 [Pluteus cervinus]|uniref:Uncharacterized protein n=1 Tax=Pluteus cervinus TaxID=181527 RepID=A0ACD3B690_9AGAR|nr:hypothetical protein BDN72DRAFT_875725 [Pluteus cervinus]
MPLFNDSVGDGSRTRHRLSFHESYILKTFYSTNPTPTNQELNVLAAQTGLDRKWVLNWFGRERTKARRGGDAIPAPVPLFTKGLLRGRTKRIKKKKRAPEVDPQVPDEAGSGPIPMDSLQPQERPASPDESSSSGTEDLPLISPMTHGPVVQVQASLLKRLVKKKCKKPLDGVDVPTGLPSNKTFPGLPDPISTLVSSDALPGLHSQVEKESPQTLPVRCFVDRAHRVNRIPLVAPIPIPLQMADAQKLDEVLSKMQTANDAIRNEPDSFDMVNLPDFDDPTSLFGGHSPHEAITPPSTTQDPFDIEPFTALFGLSQTSAEHASEVDLFKPTSQDDLSAADDPFALLMNEDLVQDESFQAAMNLVSLSQMGFQW